MVMKRKTAAAAGSIALVPTAAAVVLVVLAGAPACMRRALPRRARAGSCSCVAGPPKQKPRGTRRGKGKGETGNDDGRCATELNIVRID
jgi:hypothetical protein